MQVVTIALAIMKVAAVKLSDLKTWSLLSFIGGVPVTPGVSNLGGSKASPHVYKLRMYHVNEGNQLLCTQVRNTMTKPKETPT